MPRPSARVAFAFSLFVGVSWSSLELGCAPSSPPPDEIISTPGEDVGGGTRGSTTALTTSPVATPTTGGCDDFGTLSATSLAGKVASVNGTLRQNVALTVDNRPSRTKASIIVNGSPAALVGQTVALGVGANGNAFTCSHCLLVAVGCSANSCAQAAFFFPRAGNASLGAVASAANQPFSGALTDVELQQVTLDVANEVMAPVPGGACIRIPRLTFAAMMTATGDIVVTDTSDGGGSGTGRPGDAGEDAPSGGENGGGIGLGEGDAVIDDTPDAATGGGSQGKLEEDGGLVYLDTLFNLD